MTPRRKVDTLETGELQPRLPGKVGAVRDQELAQPTLELPDAEFSLTPPDETDHRQLTLVPED